MAANDSTYLVVDDMDLDLDQYNNFDNMEWWEGIFDILDGDDDDDDDDDNDNEDDNKDVNSVRRNRQHRSKLESSIDKYIEDFDFDALNTNLDEEEMCRYPDEETVEDPCLSQRLSQLLTTDIENKIDDDDDGHNENDTLNPKKRPLSTPSTPDVTLKRVCTWHDDGHPLNESINDIFNHFIMNSSNQHKILMSMDDLRALMIMKHRTVVCSVERKLWTIYLLSGTGQWHTRESMSTNIDRRIWPTPVKRLIAEHVRHDQVSDEHTLGETLVRQHLEKLNQQIQQYTMEYENMKKNCFGWTDSMEEVMANFVYQHSIVPYAKNTIFQLGLWECNYDDQLLQREYAHYQPTESQIKVAEHLYALNHRYLQAQQELNELKQRVLFRRPSSDMMITSASTFSMEMASIDAISDERLRQQKRDEHEKKHQRKMTDSLIVAIAEAETKVHECREAFENLLRQVSARKDDQEAVLTEKFLDLLHRRFCLAQKKFDCHRIYRIEHSLRRRQRQHRQHRCETNDNFILQLSPTIILGTNRHAFNDEQFKLLNRGPTYVPPYQMYVTSANESTIEMIKNSFKLLQHHLNILFHHTNVNLTRSALTTKEIKDAYTLIFSRPLPSSLYQRALYEHNLVESIRQHLKANRLILRRTADQQNVFYLGNRDDFENEANNYMNRTDIFEICQIVDDENLKATRDYLKTKIGEYNNQLNSILHDKTLQDQLKKLRVDADKVELPYLYFLPDISQKDPPFSVKPIVAMQRSTTCKLAHYLDQLLRPFVQRHLEPVLFRNGADFIRKLNMYADKKAAHQLRSTTIFASVVVSNFNNMVSHVTMLYRLQDFLVDNTIQPFIEGVHIHKILRLTELLLYHNRFYYDRKIYRFAKGGPTSLSYTQTLANIYLYQWCKSFFIGSIGDEFFGHCQNQIFFTWNQSEEELRTRLTLIASQDMDVRFDFEIGRRIPYLRASIDLFEGELFTMMYHDPNAQKYTLPYAIHNAKAAHSHWLRSALIRAVRYCTSVYDFDFERLTIELTCLSNGYSIEFIDKRVNDFFEFFGAMSLRRSLDQQVYEQLRRRLFNFISEQKLAAQQNQQLDKKNQRIRLFYLHAYGSRRQFHTQLRQILLPYLTKEKYLSKSHSTKIRPSVRYQYSLNALLTEQKPNHPLLHRNTMTG